MRREEILEIELALDVTLPASYVDVLLDYPFNEDRDDLFGAPHDIIDDTLFCREYGYSEGEWPAHWVVIGRVGNGDHWFIDTALDISPVFATSHDGSPAVQQDAASIDHWVELLRAHDAIPDDVWERERQEMLAKDQRVRDFFALDLRKRP